MEGAAEEPGEERTFGKDAWCCRVRQPQGAGAAERWPQGLEGCLWGLVSLEEDGKGDVGPPVDLRGGRPGLGRRRGGVRERGEMLLGAAVSSDPSPRSMPRDHVFMETG